MLFLAGAFFGGADFLAGAFLAVVFFAGADFLGVAFFVVVFFAGVLFLAGVSLTVAPRVVGP